MLIEWKLYHLIRNVFAANSLLIFDGNAFMNKLLLVEIYKDKKIM